MTSAKKCLFHRCTSNHSMGRGVGYCDLDSYVTICDGDIYFCEKPDMLKKYLLDQNRREARDGKREQMRAF